MDGRCRSAGRSGRRDERRRLLSKGHLPVSAVAGQHEGGTTDFEACRAIAGGAARPSPTEAAVIEAQRATVQSRLSGLEKIVERWRLSRRYRLTPLARGNLRSNVEPGRVPDCARCTESCCVAPHVVRLRLTDVARLIDAELQWAVVQASLQTRLPIVDADTSDGFHPLPVLAMNENGRCVFLDDDDRCSIYPIRPIVCRRYPYRIAHDLQTIAYATGCRFDRHDGGEAQTEALEAAAIESYNARLADLLLVELAPEAVRALGLERFLPSTSSDGEPFEAVLARARGSEPL